MGIVESRNEDQAQLSDGVLLSQLIQLLHRRPKHCLPLADLQALLPNSLRKRAQDHGGLKSWIQQYHSLFEVVGEVNKETVVLSISTAMPERPVRQVDSPDTEPQQEPDPAPVVEMSERRKRIEESKNQPAFDEEGQGHLAIQLRGLPYKATVEEIRNFLGTYVEKLHAENPIHLVLNRDGRPSGFARVVFDSEESARQARDELHLRGMEDRYVEVFLYPERPSKGRNRRLEEGGTERLTLAEANGMTTDVVVNECRAEMGKPGKRRMLLSMLGVNLSAGARAYLKQTDQGLKHFLAQFGSEFAIEGTKGCEYVVYNPTQEALAWMERDEKAPLSPKQSKSPPDVVSSGRVPMTPSDWGTPAPGVPPANWMPPWPAGAGPGQAGQDSAWNNNWAALQGQMQWQGAPGTGWNQYNWSNEEAQNGNINFGLDPQAIATAVYYGASAAMAAASQAGGAGGYVPAGEDTSALAIRLRGLPYAASEQDVLAFFAQHDVVDRISDGPKAVNILQRSNGKPSGQAIVQMRDRSDAELAQRVLNGQWMGNRYIEVFLHDEMTGEGHHSQNALAAATAAATAHAKLQTQAGNGQSSANGVANYAGMGMWSGGWGQSSGQMSDGQNPEWQALFSFLGDGQGDGARQPGAPNGDGATSAAVV